MPRLDPLSFRQLVEGTLSASQCKVKKAIGRQLHRIGKPPEKKDGTGGYAGWAKMASILCGMAWEGDANALVENFRKRGSGSTPMAVAFWYWLHCHSYRRPYAHAVNRVAFGKPDMFDAQFQTDPNDELSVILRRSTEATGEVGPLVDINMLGQFLDSFLIEQQTDPSLLLLLSEIERIFETPFGMLDGEPVSVRMLFNQTPWLPTQDVDTSNKDGSQWVFRGVPFMLPYQGARYVLVREDGARLSSGSLHRINSWLIGIWQLHTCGTIPEDRLDLLLRYILVLAGDGRSTFLKFYFQDADKLDIVFRAAARRARAIDMSMRDYGALDAPYDAIRRGEEPTNPPEIGSR